MITCMYHSLGTLKSHVLDSDKWLSVCVLINFCAFRAVDREGLAFQSLLGIS